MDRGDRPDVQGVPPCPRLEYGVDLARWAGHMCHGIGLMVWRRRGSWSWQKVGCTRVTRQGCNTGYGPQARSDGWGESVDGKSPKARSLRITWDIRLGGEFDVLQEGLVGSGRS